MVTKTEKIERSKRLDRIVQRGAPLLAMSSRLRQEIKHMKFQIHNMSLLAKQAEDYAADWEMLGKEDEPELIWTIDEGLYQKF